MWNKFSINIQLLIFMTVLITVVQMSTLFVILNIQEKENHENAAFDASILAKSLHNDLLKTVLNSKADLLADMNFRLEAFEKINGALLFDDEDKAIFSYKDFKNIQKYQEKLIVDDVLIVDKRLFFKSMIKADGHTFGSVVFDFDLSSHQEKYQKLTYTMLLLFLVALIFGIIVSHFLSKSYTKPFSQLLGAMQNSNPMKDDIVVVKTSAQNEIKELFDGFNNQMKQISYSTHEINQLNREIEDTQREVVFTMGAIGETRSKETGNHVKRVAQYSGLLALLYGLSEEEASLIQQASPMHDIGKVGIPDSILNKPGKFDADERKIMDTHAQLGYEMLKASSRPLLKLAATVAYEHHEKWDGSGYPRGLKGEEIHISGRITAIADVFDALGSDRVYKKAWDDERIFTLFREERGKHFDPKLIDLFFENLGVFLDIREDLKDEHLT